MQKDGAEQVMHEGLGAGSSGQSHPHIKFISILFINRSKFSQFKAHTEEILLVSGANSQINPSGGAQIPPGHGFPAASTSAAPPSP